MGTSGHKGDPGVAGAGQSPGPAWRRETDGEYRWPSVVAIGVAIALQIALPDGLVLHPTWLLPSIEGALGVVLLVANPVRLVRNHPLLRVAGLTLAVAVTVATAASAVLLVDRVLSGGAGQDARSLLGSGAAIYATTVIAFAVWYWDVDRGGPFERARGRRHPDFLFAQMTAPDLVDPNWEPTFTDYLYLSFTNSTAFSPTDTLPLARWAKMTMLVQSCITLTTLVLVVARAINVLR